MFILAMSTCLGMVNVPSSDAGEHQCIEVKEGYVVKRRVTTSECGQVPFDRLYLLVFGGRTYEHRVEQSTNRLVSGESVVAHAVRIS